MNNNNSNGALHRVMPIVTAVVLAVFFAYICAWYFNAVEGNFSLVLFCVCCVTGVYWLAERLYFFPKRQANALQLEQQLVQKRSDLAKQGLQSDTMDVTQARHRLLMQPWWLDWTAGLFPVILVVFLLRSFLFEPFKIPSGSMIPTLWVGDLILVNKFTYGLRLPVINTQITQGNRPHRGDVMVFRYPMNPNQDYIKRVIGVPGDEVSYLNKKLTINGQALSKVVTSDFFEEDRMNYAKQFQEGVPVDVAPGEAATLKQHNLLNNEARSASIEGVADFPLKENCRYSVDGVVCKVPVGHYFMMGDNRDNSLDSRYWGFVPEKNIVGKAFFVWMNFWNFSRIGSFN